MRILFLIIFSINTSAAVSISFWNIQNLFDAKGLSNLEYVPINHPEKKSFCGKKKAFWQRRNCLHHHWTEEKYLKRVTSYKLALAKLPPSNIWCFCEVEKIPIIKDILREKDFVHFAGTKNNIKGQNIVCAFDKLTSKKIRKTEELSFGPEFRHFLRIELQTDSDIISIVIVHFPSQFHSNNTRKQLMESLQSDWFKGSFLLMGDFNFKASELKSYTTYLIPFKKRPDVYGTYYYKKKNNFHFFDLVFSNLKKIQSEVLIPYLNIKDSSGLKPLPYSKKTQVGLSDHFPIRVEF